MNNVQPLPEPLPMPMPQTSDFVEYLLPLAETYRRLPRRVGPWIDQDEFLPEDQPALRLNDPSESDLRGLHLQGWVQRLVAVLDQRLAVALERPVVERRRADGRGHAVLMMFSAVVEIEDERVQRTSLVPLEPTPNAWRESTLPPSVDVLSEGQFSVWPSPWKDLWLSRYRDAVCLHLLALLGEEGAQLAERYAVWLIAQMRRRHWGPVQRARTHASVTQALALTPDALMLAQRVRQIHVRQECVSDKLYNQALDSLDRWQDVQRAAPRLLALYSLVASELDHTMQPLQALRHWVLTPNAAHSAKPALPPRFWRWLQRYGTRWLRDLRDCLHEFSPATVRGVLIYVAAFEFQGPACPVLLRSVARLYGNPNGPGRSPLSWYRSQALRVMAAWWRRSDASERRELSAWAPALANWLVDRVSPKDAAAWAQRSWQSARFFMEIDAVAERQEVAQADEADLPWTAAFDPLGVRDGRAVLSVLRRPTEIVREGREMHHCARQYLADCQAGAAVMVSVLEGRMHLGHGGWLRLATALLRPSHGGWYVAEIAGRSNGVAPAVAHRLAQRACELLSTYEAAQRSQTPWLASEGLTQEGA
ncbi:MAG: PcfJ domain-containing protein [Burkholderiales bacterium]